jgi:hypothetical protein
MFPKKLNCGSMPTTIALGTPQKRQARCANGVTAEQVRKLALQLVQKIVRRVMDNDLNVVLGFVP